jgi:hypothetical protein
LIEIETIDTAVWRVPTVTGKCLPVRPDRKCVQTDQCFDVRDMGKSSNQVNG